MWAYLMKTASGIGTVKKEVFPNNNEGCEQHYHYQSRQNQLPRNVDYRSKRDGQTEIMEDQLCEPNAAVFCAEDRKIYVADSGNDRIMSFTPEGRGEVFQWGHVADLSFSESGVLYTAQSPSVQSFNISETSRLDSFTTSSMEGSICSDRKHLYVINSRGRSVSVYDEEGKLIRKFGQKYLNLPQRIAIAREYVYVTDSFDDGSIVHVFNKYSGRYENSCCVVDARDDASGICVDDDGWVSVARHTSGCVDVYDSDFEYYCTIGKKGKTGGCLNRPTGLSLMSDGRMIVCDSGNNRIQIF